MTRRIMVQLCVIGNHFLSHIAYTVLILTLSGSCMGQAFKHVQPFFGDG